MSEEWGPWIAWAQGPQSVPSGMLVQAEMGWIGSGDFVGPIMSQDFSWDCPGDPIAQYRIRKPRGLIILEDISANVDTPAGVSEVVE